MPSRDTFFANYSSLVSAQVVSTLANFVLAVLISRHFGVAQFGLFTYAFALTELFYFLAECGFPSALVNEAPHFEYAKEFFATVFQLQMLFVVAAFTCVVVFAHWYAHGISQELLIDGVGTYVLAQAPSRTIRSVFRSMEKTKYEAMTTVIEKVVVIGFGIFAVAMNISLSNLVGGLALVGIANVIMLLFVCHRFFTRIVYVRSKRQTISAVLAAALPLGISSLFTVLNYRIGTVFLERVHGSIEVGLFGAAQRLVTPLAYISSTLQASILPLCTRRLAAEKAVVRTVVVSLLRWVVIGGIVLLLLFQIFGQKLITVVFGTSYLRASPVLRILMASVPLTFAINIAGVSAFLMRCYRQVTIAWAASSLIAIGANWMLVGSYAAEGVAYSVICSEACLLFGVLWIGKEFLGTSESLIIAASLTAVSILAIFVPVVWSCAAMMVLILFLLPKRQREIVKYLQQVEVSSLVIEESPIEVGV